MGEIPTLFKKYLQSIYNFLPINKYLYPQNNRVYITTNYNTHYDKIQYLLLNFYQFFYLYYILLNKGLKFHNFVVILYIVLIFFAVRREMQKAQTENPKSKVKSLLSISAAGQ